MTALDVFVLLLLGGATIVGFLRGFTHELLSLGAWVAGIAMLKLFHAPLAERLTDSVGTGAGASALAFAIIFLPTFIGVKLFARAVGGKMRNSIIGPFDRLLGGGFGMVKGLLAATLVFLLANLGYDMAFGGTAERPKWMTESRTYPLLNASGRAIVNFVEGRARGTPLPSETTTNKEVTK